MTERDALAGSLLKYLDARKKRIDRTLLKLLRRSGAYKRFPVFDKSLRHTVLLQGKRLRPIMTLMTYELYHGDASSVMELACAIELIHAGSLMLDDLPSMDNAHTRRGKKTNHELFGDAVTILASAGLWVEAFGIIAHAQGNTEAFIAATSRSLGKNGLVLGQYMDLFAFQKKQSLSELKECYALKTSSLFSLAVAFGAIAADAPQKERTLLEKFAQRFGLGFQIRDDIIDATASKKQSGKDVSKDAQNNKPNYVSLLGLDGARQALHAELTAATKLLQKLPKDTSRFEELVKALSL